MMIARLIYVTTAGLGLCFLMAPLVVVMPLAFNASSFLSYPLDGFSLKWFEVVLTTQPWLSSFVNSLKVAVGATILSLVLGGMAAIGVMASGRWSARVLTVLFMSPLVVPAVVLAVATFFAFARFGLVGSYAAMILAHTLLGLPLVFISVLTTMRGLNPDLELAAASLGASRWTRFWTIMLPLTMPGFLTGALFTFITSFDEVVIALFLSAPQTMTLPIALFGGLRDKLEPSIVAVALMLTIVSGLFLLSISYLQKTTAKQAEHA